MNKTISVFILMATFTSLVCSNSLHAQTKLNITPHFDSEKGEGIVHVQIAGYDTDDFCYEWRGPDYTSTAKPPLKGLDFGYYSVRITDCNQVIAANEGTACKDGKDYSVWEIFFIEGATCDGFGSSLPYHPKEVCDVEPAITLFAPPIIPSCIDKPKYEWTAHGHVVEGNNDYLKNQIPGQYCLHISNYESNKKCKCEAYICQFIPSIGEDFDVVAESKAGTLKWLNSKSISNNKYVLWEYLPGLIKIKIEDFDPEIEYEGYLVTTNRKGERNVSPDIDMIPGRTIDLQDQASLTNLGYGRFIMDSGDLIIGDEICVNMQDTCGNLISECIEVSSLIEPRSDEEESTLTQSDLIDKVSLEKIISKLESLTLKSEFDFEIEHWQVTNSRHIFWNNTKLNEIFNKETGKYLLISALE